MLLHNDKTKVWLGITPELSYIGIEKVDRYIGNYNPEWMATLVAHRPEDIELLLNLKSLEYLEVGFTTKGDSEIYENNIIFLTLKNCTPQTGWFDNLVTPVPHEGVDTLIVYRLIVSCDVVYTMDGLINL